MYARGLALDVAAGKLKVKKAIRIYGKTRNTCDYLCNKPCHSNDPCTPCDLEYEMSMIFLTCSYLWEANFLLSLRFSALTPGGCKSMWITRNLRMQGQV